MKTNGFDKFIIIAEYSLILGVTGISLIIAFLDLFELLDPVSPIAQKIPALTLLAVGSVASYLVLERRRMNNSIESFQKQGENILDSITRSSDQVIKSLDGVKVVSFSSSAELVTYAAERYRNAKCIDNITWSGSSKQPRTRRDLDAYTAYQSAISEVAKRPDALWREVVIFGSIEHFKREKERILDEENVGYSLGYYEQSVSNGKVPRRLGFAIVDNEEMFVSYSPSSVWLLIKHPEIIKYFSAYFEDIWKDATKLKQADDIDYDELEAIGNELAKHLPE